MVAATSVLFCCSQNAIRSPMAAALTGWMFGHRLFVESVGLRAGTPDPFAAAVMEEIGLDISGYAPKTFDDLDETSFDLIVSLSPDAHHRAIELTRVVATEVEFWNTFDPSLVEGNRESRLAAYRAVRDGLKDQIAKRFSHPNASSP